MLSIGPIESNGLDGPIIILLASKSAFVTSFVGNALLAPMYSISFKTGSAFLSTKYS